MARFRGKLFAFLGNEVTLAVVPAVLVLMYGLAEETVALPVKPLAAFEHWLLDLRYDQRGNRPTPKEVAIIAIDEKSMAKYGKFPWPRNVYASFVDSLAANYQPAALGFDIMFLDVDPPKEIVYLQGREKTLEEEVARTDLSAEARSRAEAELTELREVIGRLTGDEVFAASLEKVVETLAPVVAIDASYNEASPAPVSSEVRQLLDGFAYPNGVNQVIQSSLTPMRTASSLKLPIDKILDFCGGIGLATVIPDPDSVIRHLPLGISYNKSLFKPLSVEILTAYFLREGPTDISVSYEGETGMLTMWGRKTPLDAKNRVTLNYYGPPGTFPTYSFADVVAGSADVPPEALRDKILILGSKAQGAFDHYPSPYGAMFPGVEIQSSFVANMLDGSALRKYALAERPIAYMIGVVVIGLFVGIAVRMQASSLAAGVAVALAAAWIVLSFWLFHRGIWLHTSTPLVAVGLGVGSAMLRRAAREEMERARMRSMFGPMVSHELMEEMEKDPDLIRLGGDKRNVTLVFADLAGFTSLSEQLSMEGLHEVLTEYFTEMSAAIKAHRGYVDKYMGDGIMSIFGAPVRIENHALAACKAAVEMKKRLGEINVRLNARGLKSVSVRIGMHSGECKVGNFGAQDRFNYTALGDTVNLASRMEGVNKEYKTIVMISDETLKAAGETVCVREIDQVRVVGKDEPTRIYELVAVGEKVDRPNHALYAEALKHYREQRFPEAVAVLERSLQADPNDGPSKILKERAQGFIAAPPPADWDGVFDLAHK